MAIITRPSISSFDSHQQVNLGTHLDALELADQKHDQSWQIINK